MYEKEQEAQVKYREAAKAGSHCECNDEPQAIPPHTPYPECVAPTVSWRDTRLQELALNGAMNLCLQGMIDARDVSDMAYKFLAFLRG